MNFQKSIFTIFVFLFCFLKGLVFCGYDDGISVYVYNGIPGCGCFDHCQCFSHYVSDSVSGGFPGDTKWHPQYFEDKIWHEFMKKFLSAKAAGPYFVCDRSSIRHMVTGSGPHSTYLCLLSEYLDAANSLGRILEQARVDNIEAAKKMYYKPSHAELLRKKIEQINSQGDKARTILATIPGVIIPLYKDLINNCPHKYSYNLMPLYNKGLINLLEGNVNDSLENINEFIELAMSNQQENLLKSEVFQKQGEAYLEVGLYHEAIKALSTAISKDPKNLQAYFQRASAYFEIGDFEKSLEDYILSRKREYFVPYPLPANDFTEAFSLSAFHGARDAAVEFVPSLCSSIYGLGQCLWTFGEHPIESVNVLAGACYEMGEHVFEFFKTLDKEKLNKYADELVVLYQNYNQLSDREKGELLGYALGKYGTEIFAGSAIFKAATAFKQLREANRICNLESMILSNANKEVAVSNALRHCTERSKFFKEIQIHWDRQNKHVPGKHNYVEGRSIFEHSNAQDLLNRFAGKGIPIKNRVPGKPDYRERINFGEHIGYHINEETGIKTKTNWGEIRYSKTGAHIIPAYPGDIQ